MALLHRKSLMVYLFENIFLIREVSFPKVHAHAELLRLTGVKSKLQRIFSAQSVAVHEEMGVLWPWFCVNASHLV